MAKEEKPIRFVGTGIDPQIQVTIKKGESATVTVIPKTKTNGN